MTTATISRQDVEQGGRDDQGQHAISSPINVGSRERWISTGAGSLLVLDALRHFKPRNLLIGGVGAMLLRRGLTGHCDVYALLGVNRVQGEGASGEEYFERGIHVVEAFTINKPAEELYRFWRRFDNLPTFMKHLESVQTL